MHTRLATSQDIEGVLSLQDQYLYSNLSPLQRLKGFVTTPFTEDQILEILQQDGLFVAINKNEEIIGYLFAGSWDYFAQWPIFNFMVSRFPELSYKGRPITVQNSFQYGPVCIEEAYRGSGLLNLMFEEMRLVFKEKYPLSVTFINAINTVSENAHINKLGWDVIDRFSFNHNNYIGLAFEMKYSVLID